MSNGCSEPRNQITQIWSPRLGKKNMCKNVLFFVSDTNHTSPKVMGSLYKSSKSGNRVASESLAAGAAMQAFPHPALHGAEKLWRPVKPTGDLKNARHRQT